MLTKVNGVVQILMMDQTVYQLVMYVMVGQVMVQVLIQIQTVIMVLMRL